MNTTERIIKQVSVTFEFDPGTETVSNLKCFIDGVEKKKTTTRSKKKEEVILEDEPIITLEETKLVFNNKCASEMQLEYQDRVAIKYEKIKGVKKPIPIIGKGIFFGEEELGNKVTKTNTVAYRGNANKILLEYGKKFTIEPYITSAYSEGIFKLVALKDGDFEIISTDEDSYEDVVTQAENIDLSVFTDKDDETEINEMTFKL